MRIPTSFPTKTTLFPLTLINWDLSQYMSHHIIVTVEKGRGFLIRSFITINSNFETNSNSSRVYPYISRQAYNHLKKYNRLLDLVKGTCRKLSSIPLECQYWSENPTKKLKVSSQNLHGCPHEMKPCKIPKTLVTLSLLASFCGQWK